jgi:hypothetical protein
MRRGSGLIVPQQSREMRLWLALTFCIIFITGCGNSSRGEKTMSYQMPDIELEIITHLEWDNPLKLDVVEVGPPSDGSFIDLPGPKRRPVRPYLEPLAGPNGIAARVLRGDGQVMPFIVVVGEPTAVVPLAKPPRAISVRADGGLWVLNDDSLGHYDQTGNQLDTLELSGMTLVGGADNAVWVVSHDTATYIDTAGRIEGSYTWQAGLNSVDSNNSICALGKGAPRQVHCLNPDGQKTFIDLAVSPGPFEHLLLITDDAVFTLAGAILRHYSRASDEIAQIIIQAAGLTSANTAFASGRDNGQVKLWEAGQAVRHLSLPSNTAVQGAFPVVSVQDTRSLVYGLDQAIWYDGDDIDRTFVVDEGTYRSEVFPHLWRLGPTGFAASSRDETIILSATGPSGVTLIGLRWDLN